MEGSLGLALHVSKICKPKEEPKKAPIVLMEDNLSKAKKALMTPKQLCPTAAVLENRMRRNWLS